MYKVREKADMDVDVGDFQMAKSPITTSHGDSLADQSFQSFKTKEIRDSESPTHDLKFKTHALTDRSGWNVSTSLEVTPDGKGRVTESLMSTGGLQRLPDGVSEFAGKNKHLTQVYHDGDDKNFVSSKAESSKTHLEETIKKGGDNFNQTESTSVTTKFSSSQAIQSHQSVANDFDDLVASALPNKVINTTTSRREESIDKKKPIHDEHVTQKHFQNVEHQNQQLHKEHQHTEQKTLQNVTNQSTSNQKQQIVRTLQEEAEILAAKPGTIISRTIEYPDPNTKVITETKSLPDGTTVTTRKYETKSASSKTFRSSSNQEQYHTSRTVVEDRGQRNCLEYVLDDGTSNKSKIQSKPTGGVPGQKTMIDTINRETINNRNVTRDNIGTQQNTFIKKTPKEHPTDSLPSKDTLDHEVEYISVAPAHRVPKKIPADKLPLRDMEDFIETERGCVMIDKRTPMPEKYTAPSRQDIPVTRQVERDATTQTQTSRSVQEHREIIESHEHKEHKEHKEHREVKKITQENQGYLPEPTYTDTGSYPSDKRPSDLREPKPDFSTHGFPSVKPPYNHDYPMRPASRQPSETKESRPDFSTHGFPSVKTSPKTSEFSHPGDYNHPSTPQSRPQTIRSEPQPIQPHKITQSEQTTSSRRESTDSTYQKETTTTTTSSTAQTTFEKTTPSYPAGKPSYTKVKETDLTPPKQVSRQPEKTCKSPREYIPNESSRTQPAGVPSYQRPLNREPRTRDHPMSPTSYAPVDSPETRAAGKPSYTQTKTTEVVRTEVYEYPDQIDKPRTPLKPGDYDQPNKDESLPRDYPTKPGDHQPYNQQPFATNDVRKPIVPRHDLREPADGVSTPGSTRPVTPTERPQGLDDKYFSPDRRSPGDEGVPGFQMIPQKAAGKPSYNKPKLMDDTPDDYEISKLTKREIAVLKQERTDVTTKKISVEVSATHDAFARSLRCISPVDKDRGSVRSIKTSTSSIRSSVSPDKKTRRSPSTETPQRITRTSTPRYQQPTKASSRSPDSHINRYKSNETVDLTTTRLQEDEVRRRGTKTTTTKTVETRKPHKPTNRIPEDTVPRSVQKSPEHLLGPYSQPTYDEDISPVVVMRKDRPSVPEGEPNERKSRPNTFTFDSDTEPIAPDDGQYTVEPTDKRKPVESLPTSPSKILKQSKEPKPSHAGLPRGTTYDIDDAPHPSSITTTTARSTKPTRNLTEKSPKPTRPALRRDQTPDIDHDGPSSSPYRSSSPTSKSPTRTVSRPTVMDSPRPTGKSPKHTHPGVSQERTHRRSPSPFESSPTKTVIKTTTTKLVTSTDTKKTSEKSPRPTRSGLPKDATKDVVSKPYRKSPRSPSPSESSPTRAQTTTTRLVTSKDTRKPTDRSPQPTRPGRPKETPYDVEERPGRGSSGRSPSPGDSSPTRTKTTKTTTRLITSTDTKKPTDRSPQPSRPGRPKETTYDVEERTYHRSPGRSPSPFDTSPTRIKTTRTTTRLVTSRDTKKPTERSPQPTRPGRPKETPYDVEERPGRRSFGRSPSPGDSSPTRGQTNTTTTRLVTSTDTKKPTDRSPQPTRPRRPKETTDDVKERPYRRSPGRSPSPSESSPTRTQTTITTTRLITSTDTEKPTDRSPQPTRPGHPQETPYDVEEKPRHRSPGRSPSPSDSSPARTQTTKTTTRLITSTDTEKPTDRSPKPTRPGRPKETTDDMKERPYRRSPGRSPSPGDSSPTRSQTTTTTTRLVTSTDTKKPTDRSPQSTRPGHPKETTDDVEERPYRRFPGRNSSPSDSSPTRTQTTTTTTRLITSTDTEKPTDRSPKPTRPGRPKGSTDDVEERPYRRSPGRSPSPSDSSPKRTETTKTTTRLITSTDTEKPTDRSPQSTRPGHPKETTDDVEERPYRRFPGRSSSPSDSSPTRTQTTTTTTRLITSTDTEKPTDRSPKPTRPGRPKETIYDVEETTYHRSPGRSPSPSDSSPKRTETTKTTTRLITSTDTEKPTDRSPRPSRPGRPKETPYDVEEKPYRRSPGRSPSPSDSSPTRTQTTTTTTRLITSTDIEKPTDRSPQPTRPGRPKETPYDVEETPYHRSPGRSPSPGDSSPTRTQTTKTRLITSTDTKKPTDRSPQPTRPGRPKETTYDVEETPYHRSPGRSPSPGDSSPTRTQTTKTRLITSTDTEKPTDRSPKPSRPGRPKETPYDVEEKPSRRSPGRSPSPSGSYPIRTQTTKTTTRLITSTDTKKPTDRSPQPTRPGRPKETPYDVEETPYHRSPGRSPSPSDSSPTRTQTTKTTTRLITSTDIEKPTDRSPQLTRPGRPKETPYDVEETPYHRSPGRSPSPSDSSPTRTQTTKTTSRLITSTDTEKGTDRSPQPSRPGRPKETPYDVEEKPYHRSPGRSPSPGDSSPTRTQTTKTTTRLITSTDTEKPTDRSPKPSRPGRPKETTYDVEETPYYRSPGRSPSPSDSSPTRTRTTKTTTRLITSTDTKKPTDRSPQPTRPGRPKETPYDVEETPYHRSPGRSPSPGDSSPTRTQTTKTTTRLITSTDTEKPTDRSPKPSRPGRPKETTYDVEETPYYRSPGRSPSPSDSSPTRTRTTKTTTRLITSTDTKKPTDRSPQPTRPGRPKETIYDVEETTYHRSPGRSPSPGDSSPTRTQTTKTRLITSTDTEKPTDRSPKPSRPGRPKETPYDVEEKPSRRSPGRSPSPSGSYPIRTQTTKTTTRLITSTDTKKPTDRSPQPTRPGRPKETPYDVEETPYHRSPGRSPSPSDSSPTRTQTTKTTTRLITSTDIEKPTDRSPQLTRPGRPKETPYDVEETPYHRSPGRSPSPSDSSPTRTQTTKTTSRLITSTDTEKGTDRSPQPSRPGRPKETPYDVEEKPYRRSPGRGPSPSDSSSTRTQTTTTTTRLITSTDIEKPTDRSPKPTRPGCPKEETYDVEERPYRRSPGRSPSPGDSSTTRRTTTVESITSKDSKRPTKKSPKDTLNDVEERLYKRRSGSPVDVDYDFDEPSSTRSPCLDEIHPHEKPKTSKKPVKDSNTPSIDKALKTPVDKSVPLTPVRQSKYPKDVSPEDIRPNDAHPEDVVIDRLIDKRTKDIKSTKQTRRTTTEDFISHEQRTFEVNKIGRVQTEDTTPYESENNEPETSVRDTDKPDRSYLRSPERKPSYGDSPDRTTKKHPSTDFNKVPQKSPGPKAYDTSPSRKLPESVSEHPRKKDEPVTLEKPTSRTPGRQYTPDEPSQKPSKRYYSKSPEREPNDKSQESLRRSTVPIVEPDRCIPSYKTRPDSPSEINSPQEKYPQRKLREPMEPSTPKGVRPSYETSPTEKKPRKPSASKPTSQHNEPEDITIEVVLQKDGKDIHLTTTVEDAKQTTKTNEYVETIERRRSTGPTKQHDAHERPIEPFFLKPEKDRPTDTEKVKPKVPYNRSETYEERCMKILGMDNPEENIKTKPKSRYDDTSDFITTEVTHVTENRGVKPTKPTEDIRGKPTRIISPTSRSPAPSREMSPTKRSTGKPKEDMPKFDKKPTTQDKPYEDTKSKKKTSPMTSEEPRDYDDEHPENQVRRPSYSSTAEIIIGDVRDRSSSPEKRSSPGFENLRKTQPQYDTSVTRRTSKTKQEYTHSDDELIVEVVRSTKNSGPKSPERLSMPKTNKTHLSPLSSHKPSSPDRQEYLKTDKTVTTSSRRAVVEDSTTKSSKSIVTKSTVVRPSKDKLPISQSPNERIGRERKPISSDRKKPKFTDDSEQETDIVTDEETGTTITKTKTTVKTTKKLPVFERKESAPVTPVTKKDKIMTRSTSDNVLRTTTPRKSKPELHPISSKPTEKSPLKTHTEKKVPTEKSSPRRPTKCMTTKTINLSSTTKLLTPDDMENIVIDIQQAKSSREPTPNKIIPTPVLDNLDTGAQRYPDTVQEPEDVPRRKPKIKNIPIFEEETNDFVGCHIEEVNDDTDTIEEDSHKRQIKTTTRDETFVDECLLSVHDKVNKFTITAEEVKKPKPSAPFRPEPRLEDVTDTEDECLLSVNDKVNKFLTTAESISKRPVQHDSKWKPERPDLDNIDENLRTDDCVLSVSEKVNKFTSTAQKLSETAPQKSPELVAKITKQIYPRNKLEEEPYLEEPSYRPASPQRSPGLVASIEKQRTNPEYYEVIPDEQERKRTRPTVTERYNPDKPKDIIRHTISPSVTARSSVQKVKSVFEKEPVSVQHERPRQRDILSRPSVWDSKKPKDVKLEDIGIHRSPEREIIEVTETTVTKHEPSPLPGSSTRKPSPRVPTKTQKITADVVSSKKDIFEKRISNSTRETIEIQPTTTTMISRTSTKKVPVTQKPSSIKKIAEKFSAPAKPTGSPIKSSPKIVKEHIDETFVDRRPKDYLKEPGTHQSPRKTYTVPKDDIRESSPGHVPKGGRHPERPNKPKAGAVEYIEEEYYSKRRTSRTDEETVTEQHTDSTRRVRNGDISPSRHYMEHTVSSIEHRRDSESLAPGVEELDYSPRESLPRSSSPSPSRHFMEHTVSSMEHRRDSDLAIPSLDDHHCHVDGHQPTNLPSDKKFGVELKHSPLKDSRPRRKSSSSDIPHIEEIYDLDLLEKMLETVVGYEQRRRIRAQIRVVKKTVESQSHTKRITQTTKKVSEPSLTRKPAASTSRPKTDSTPDKIVQTVETTHLYTGKPKEIIYIPTKTTTTMTSAKTEFRMVGKGPEKTITTKKTVVSSSKEPKDEPPIWTSKNILKKPSDNDRAKKTTTVLKKTTGTGSIAATKQKIVKSKVQVTSDEDCITSSYGIGPTDDNGEPLFGIKALKKKTTTTSTGPKVSGRIITKKFYSENGAEPVSEETVVTYGTDQDDTDNLELIVLDDDDSTERKVIKRGGVTTTIVKKGNVTSRKDSKVIPEITEKTTKQSKVVRRGSVKEISEKFVRKESSSSVSERTTSSSYPKAGLILRTQTRTGEEIDIPENMNIHSDSGEYEDVTDDNVEIQSSSTSNRKESKTFSKQIVSETESETESRSFLDSQGTKITGVKDVIQRMKNADYVVDDGDTPEDQEARSLFNKFLGASVIMSGVETMVPKEVTTTITQSPSTKGQVTTTRVTKTIRSGSSSSPVVSKTCDIEEIDDEKILKQLLEESTNYEDRRKIRARLRKIMADREACTDTVEEEQVTTEETKNGKTIKTTTTTRKTNGGQEEVETTVEEEEASEDEEEDEEEEEEEEDDEEEEEVEVVEEVEEDIKEIVGKEKKESEQRNEKEEEQEEDNDSDYEEVEVVEVVEVEESDEEDDSKDSQEVKVETVKKLEESVNGNEVKNQNTTVKVEEDGTKVITTTTTVVKETSDPKKTESRELVLSSKEDVNLLMDKPHISQSSSASQEEVCTTETTETKEKDGAVVTTKTKVTTRTVSGAPKVTSPFALFKQLDKQNPSHFSTPTHQAGKNNAPLFKFTDPALNVRAATVKEQLLQWCQIKTKEYENVQISNFSTSWSDGLAFCALIHHFLPDAFDYSTLTPQQRRHNFELAFRVADEKAGIAPLLDVEDMVVMKRPDWKCVFTYVQTIYRRFRNSD